MQTITPFTPVAAFAGGVLIGVASVGLMLTSGRIAGIAGILRRVLMPDPQARPLEGLAFLLGLLIAPRVWSSITNVPILQTVSNNLALLIVAGILVGFGSILGSGCTSGHGVCGLSRLSRRSLIATVTFMTTAALTVFIQRHVIGG